MLAETSPSFLRGVADRINGIHYLVSTGTLGTIMGEASTLERKYSDTRVRLTGSVSLCEPPALVVARIIFNGNDEGAYSGWNYFWHEASFAVARRHDGTLGLRLSIAPGEIFDPKEVNMREKIREGIRLAGRNLTEPPPLLDRFLAWLNKVGLPDYLGPVHKRHREC